MGHIELARWADLILIAPASANFLARLRKGQGDDLLTTVCLAAQCPVAVAPAMNQAMWSKPRPKPTRATLRPTRRRYSWAQKRVFRLVAKPAQAG